MRKVLYIALAVMLCGLYAVAQDYPKAEVFGGFSVIHADNEGFNDAAATALTGVPGSTVRIWYPGWEVSGQYNFTKMLGVKADLAGNYGTPLSVPGFPTPSASAYTFLFGPVVSFRGSRVTPFAHALFGGNRTSIGAYTETGTPANSETAFAMAFGGGVDVKVSQHFAVRVGQFDYLYTNHCLDLFDGLCDLGTPGFPAAHQNNFRFATGIVIHP